MLAELDYDTFTQSDDALNTIAGIVFDVLATAGVPKAKTLSAACTARLAADLGGTYVPRGVAHHRAIRDAQIRALHDGTHGSVVSLAKQFAMSEIHIYRILSAKPRPCRATARRPA